MVSYPFLTSLQVKLDTGLEVDFSNIDAKKQKLMSKSEFHLLEQNELLSLQVSQPINRETRAASGQYLTPSPIAKLVAEPFRVIKVKVGLIDSGAGVGIFTAVFVENFVTLYL